MMYLTLVELVLKKYWKILALVLALGLIVIGWRYDRASQYKAGYRASENAAKLETDRLNAKLQGVERNAQDKLDQKNKEIEDDRKKTSVAVSALQLESNGLRQQLQNKQFNLNAAVTSGTTSKTDASELTASWQLLGKCAETSAGLAKTADEYRDLLKESQDYGQVLEDYRKAIQQ